MKLATLALAAAVDLLPTSAKLAGAELPDRGIDGRDILPLITGGPDARSPHENQFSRYHSSTRMKAHRASALPSLASAAILLVACSPDPVAPDVPTISRPDFPTVEATVTAISAAPEPADLSPYEESLVEFQYHLDNVSQGEFPHADFRVAHWGVLEGKPVAVPALGASKTLTLIPFREVPGIANFHFTSDLDPLADLPVFLDQPTYDALRRTPSGRRYDYGSAELSARMEIYWLTRHQLKLVVVGNSHAGSGIQPGDFYRSENAVRPVAISLASAAASLDTQYQIASSYTLDLPELEWVIWCVSPRLFNQSYRPGPRDAAFTASSGRVYDLEHADELWPVPAGSPPVSTKITEAVWNQRDPWGGSNSDDTMGFPSEEERRAYVVSECSKPSFTNDPTAWEKLESYLAAADKKPFRVFLFIPPTHPDTLDAVCSDPDGTSHKDLQRITASLAEIAAKYPRVTFADYSNPVQHGFTHEEFSDIDHLNSDGADDLTTLIIAELAKSTPAVAD